MSRVASRFIECHGMNGPISKVDAAKEQLDGALDLIDSRSLCAHALAYNAYCLLRDLLSVDMTKFEKALRLREVAEFIKHAKSDPYDILTEHSPKTAHLVTVAAIALWEANEQRLTDAMREFKARPDPYKPGHRHSAALQSLQQGSIPDATSIVTLPSTVSDGPIRRQPRGEKE